MPVQNLGETSGALTANAFTRENYKFTGWNTAANGSGTPYAAGATYDGPSITLYAQWEYVTYMQTYTKANCAIDAVSNEIAVTDQRDGEDYTVRYINDNCWMTQNLRIAMGIELESSLSNVDQPYIIPSADSAISGDSATEGRVHQSGNDIYGNWYNFCAASAGTACSGVAVNTTYDICPAGWRLPTVDEFAFSADIRPVKGGTWVKKGLVNENFGGYWWTSSRAYDDRQRFIFYNGTFTSDYNPVSSNYYVRCIAK